MIPEWMRGVRRNGRAFVMFLIGFLLGGGTFLVIYAQKVDAYLSERNVIYYANNQKYKEILKLQGEIARLTRSREDLGKEADRIKKIDVEVRSDQPAVIDAVKSLLEEKLSPFLDKSMQWISNNPDLVELILEKNRLEIDKERRFKVEVHLRYLSFHNSTMKIWVDVKEIDGEDVSKSATFSNHSPFSGMMVP